jgi:hypothetical protein
LDGDEHVVLKIEKPFLAAAEPILKAARIHPLFPHFVPGDCVAVDMVGFPPARPMEHLFCGHADRRVGKLSKLLQLPQTRVSDALVEREIFGPQLVGSGLLGSGLIFHCRGARGGAGDE